MTAKPRSHVAHNNVRRAAEPLEQEALDRRLAEIPAEDLDSGQRRDGDQIDGEHPAGRDDAFSGDLRPTAGRSSQVDDNVPLSEQAIAEVDLGELDRCAAAIRLFLRRAVKPVVAAGLHPGFAHRTNEDRRLHNGFLPPPAQDGNGSAHGQSNELLRFRADGEKSPTRRGDANSTALDRVYFLFMYGLSSA